MGLLDDLKFHREARREFKGQVSLAKVDLERTKIAEMKAREKLGMLLRIKENGEVDKEYFRLWNQGYVVQLQENPGLLEMAISDARQDFLRWYQKRDRAEKELKVLRPNTRKDIDEREVVFGDFAGEVLAVDPSGVLDLRFHATSFAVTKDIIESGGLISSIDRLDGYLETTNYSNEISVSKIQDLQYSVNYWMDVRGYNGCRPCGCMFVVQPRSAEEAAMISGRQMHNVLFHEHPEQLVAIVTTTENMDMVNGWLRENGLAQVKVSSFGSFAGELEKMKADLVPEYKKENLERNEGRGMVASVSSVIQKAKSEYNLSGKSEYSCRTAGMFVVGKD